MKRVSVSGRKNRSWIISCISGGLVPNQDCISRLEKQGHSTIHGISRNLVKQTLPRDQSCFLFFKVSLSMLKACWKETFANFKMSSILVNWQFRCLFQLKLSWNSIKNHQNSAKDQNSYSFFCVDWVICIVRKGTVLHFCKQSCKLTFFSPTFQQPFSIDNENAWRLWKRESSWFSVSGLLLCLFLPKLAKFCSVFLQKLLNNA